MLNLSAPEDGSEYTAYTKHSINITKNNFKKHLIFVLMQTNNKKKLPTIFGLDYLCMR